MTDQDEYQPDFAGAAKRGIKDFSEDENWTPDPKKVRSSGKVFDFTEGYDPDADAQEKARRKKALPKAEDADWNEGEVVANTGNREGTDDGPKGRAVFEEEEKPIKQFPLPYSDGARPWEVNEGPQQGFREQTGLREGGEPESDQKTETGPEVKPSPTGLREKEESTGLREKEESTGLREDEKPTGVVEKEESTDLREGKEQTGLREGVDGVMPDPEDSEDKDTSTYGVMRNPDLAARYMEHALMGVAQAAAEMGGQMVSRGWDLARDIVRMTFTQPHAMSSTSRMIGTAMGSLEMAGDFADRAAQKYGINLQQDPELMKDTIKYKLYKREAQQANGVVGNTFRAIAGSLNNLGVQDISQMTPDQLSQHVADMRQEAARLNNIIAQDKANTQFGKRQNRLSSQDRALVYAQAKHLQSYLDQLSRQGATMAADQRAMARQQRQASRQQRLQAQSTLANGQANPYQQILQWADPNANWEIDGTTGMPTRTGAYNDMLRTLRDRREQERMANNGVLDPAREQWFNQMDQDLTRRRDDVQREARHAPLRKYGNVFVGMSDHAPGIGQHIDRILRFGIWPSTVPVKSIRDYLSNIVSKGAAHGASAAEINHAQALLLSLDMHTRSRSLVSKISHISPKRAAYAMRYHIQAKDRWATTRLDAVEAKNDEVRLAAAYRKLNAALPKDFATAQNFNPNDPAFQQALHEYERELIKYENKWFPGMSGNRQRGTAQPGQAGPGQSPPGPSATPAPAPTPTPTPAPTPGATPTPTPTPAPTPTPGATPAPTPGPTPSPAPAPTPTPAPTPAPAPAPGPTPGGPVNPTGDADAEEKPGARKARINREFRDVFTPGNLPDEDRRARLQEIIGDHVQKLNEWGRFTNKEDFQAARDAFIAYHNATNPSVPLNTSTTNAFDKVFAPNSKKDQRDRLRSMNEEVAKKKYFAENGIVLDADGKLSPEEMVKARDLLRREFPDVADYKIDQFLKGFRAKATPTPQPQNDEDSEPEFFDDGRRNWISMPMLTGDEAADMESAKKIYDALGDDPKAFLEDVLQKVNTKSDKVKFSDVGQMLDAFGRLESMESDDPLFDSDVYMETKDRADDDPVRQATLVASRVADMRPYLEKMGVWDDLVGKPAQPAPQPAPQSETGTSDDSETADNGYGSIEDYSHGKDLDQDDILAINTFLEEASSDDPAKKAHGLENLATMVGNDKPELFKKLALDAIESGSEKAYGAIAAYFNEDPRRKAAMYEAEWLAGTGGVSQDAAFNLKQVMTKELGMSEDDFRNWWNAEGKRYNKMDGSLQVHNDRRARVYEEFLGENGVFSENFRGSWEPQTPKEEIDGADPEAKVVDGEQPIKVTPNTEPSKTETNTAEEAGAPVIEEVPEKKPIELDPASKEKVDSVRERMGFKEDEDGFRKYIDDTIKKVNSSFKSKSAIENNVLTIYGEGSSSFWKKFMKQVEADKKELPADLATADLLKKALIPYIQMEAKQGRLESVSEDKTKEERKQKIDEREQRVADDTADLREAVDQFRDERDAKEEHIQGHETKEESNPLPRLTDEKGRKVDTGNRFWIDLINFTKGMSKMGPEERRAAIGDVKAYNEELQKRFDETAERLSDPEYVERTVSERREIQERQIKAEVAAQTKNALAEAEKATEKTIEGYLAKKKEDPNYREKGHITRAKNKLNALKEQIQKNSETNLKLKMEALNKEMATFKRNIQVGVNNTINAMNTASGKWSEYTKDLIDEPARLKTQLQRVAVDELEEDEPEVVETKVYKTLDPQEYVEQYKASPTSVSYEGTINNIKAAIKERFPHAESRVIDSKMKDYTNQVDAFRPVQWQSGSLNSETAGHSSMLIDPESKEYKIHQKALEDARNTLNELVGILNGDEDSGDPAEIVSKAKRVVGMYYRNAEGQANESILQMIDDALAAYYTKFPQYKPKLGNEELFKQYSDQIAAVDSITPVMEGNMLHDNRLSKEQRAQLEELIKERKVRSTPKQPVSPIEGAEPEGDSPFGDHDNMEGFYEDLEKDIRFAGRIDEIDKQRFETALNSLSDPAEKKKWRNKFAILASDIDTAQRQQSEEDKDDERLNGFDNVEGYVKDFEEGNKQSTALTDEELAHIRNAINTDPNLSQEEKEGFLRRVQTVEDRVNIASNMEDLFPQATYDDLFAMTDMIQRGDWDGFIDSIDVTNFDEKAVDDPSRRVPAFEKFLQSIGLDKKEIDRILSQASLALEGVSIKFASENTNLDPRPKSFREIMRERNPDWE